MTSLPMFPAFSRFRTELENEVIRQQAKSMPTPSMHLRRTTDMELNPGARTSYVVLLNTGLLPIFTLANLLECVFHKDTIEVLPQLWELQQRGPMSYLRVYLTNHVIATNKIRQANGWLQLAAGRMKIPTSSLPVFLMEEYLQ